MSGNGSIDRVAAELTSTFNAADAVKLASLCAETAILMPPNEELKKDGWRYWRGFKRH